MKKASLQEITYYVKGMHCAACELTIEKKLLEDKNISSVEASVGRGQVVVFYKQKKPSVGKLNQIFAESDYTFSEKPLLPQKENKFFQSAQILGIALLLIAAFIFLSRPSIAARVVVSSTSSLPAFFLFGLMAGASSCAALVGGLVLSMSKKWSGQTKPHVLFNLGRLLAFAFFGALLGGLGGLVQISLTASALLSILVSLMMVVLALQMLGVKQLQKFQITVPKFLSRFIADETNFQGRYLPFVLGTLTFFLPCGFTLTTQGLALVSGSSLRGAMTMIAFALGTLPMLIIVGFSTLKITAKPHLSNKFLVIAGILVLFFGIYNFNYQLNLLGLPSLTDIGFSSSKRTPVIQDGLAPMISGKQLLQMDAFAYRYEPSEFKVRVGIPVRWEIKNKGVSGCTNAIVSKGLFDGQISLDKEINIKEFTPQKAGRYKFSCWMGMVSGTITVVNQDGSISGSGNPVNQEEIPSGAGGCSCGGGCQGTR